MKKSISRLLMIITSFLIISSCTTSYKSISSYWDKKYLLNHPEISELITQYHEGFICPELKTLYTDKLTHAEMAHLLQEKGYHCKASPLYFLPNGEDKRFLTKSGESTLDPNSKNLVYQEIWLHGHCSVRIKAEGFPGNRRPYPHANKAIIINPREYSYDNEAFKITNDGMVVPKGPGGDVGMKKCTGDKAQCDKEIDMIMLYLHPKLKSPSPGKFCSNI